ncbi:MAG: hypothetical protein WBC17_14055 [Mycobacterium sp.]|jgi:hypothetical protein|nr:hypothetical protein [Mycobacterium sp.]
MRLSRNVRRNGRRVARAGSLVLATGILTGVFAATAAADTANSVDDVLSTLADLGITEFGAADLGINGLGIADLGIAGLGIDGLGPVDAGELERSLCPVLADRGQDAVDVAAKVADGIGRPLGVGTMFTGTAISFLCPRAVDNVVDTFNNGTPLLPIFGS